MYKVPTLLGLIIGLLNACQQSAPTDDPEKLKKVLQNYFDGIKNKDFKKMLGATTDDFVLFESGKVWNNDSAFKNMRKHMPYSVDYKFSNFRINVDNLSGDMTYYNHADFVFRDTVKENIDWIESATFRKKDGAWKMNLLHVTERR